jgi:hypothetical protein
MNEEFRRAAIYTFPSDELEESGIEYPIVETSALCKLNAIAMSCSEPRKWVTRTERTLETRLAS